MGKVVAKVALVVGAVALIATGVGAIVGTAAVTAALGGISAAALTAAAGLLSLGASLLNKPKSPTVSEATKDRLNVSVNIRAPRIAAMGDTALATDLRDQEYTGADKEWLHRFIVAAAHRVNSIYEIWLDDKLAWTLAGGVQGEFIGYLEVTPILEGSAANAINISARMGASRRFTGCAYVYMRFKLTGNGAKKNPTESPFSSQVPTRMTIKGQGMPCYDPRQDSTQPGGSGAHRANDQGTWTWGPHARNPACQLATWLLGWRIQNPVSGVWRLSVGKGIPADRIDWPSFMSSANLCDEPIALAAGGTEPRYRADGLFSEADAPQSVVESYKAAMYADLDDQDGLLRLTVFHNDLAFPDADFTDADIEGDYQWLQTPLLNDSFNVVRGTYVEPASLYQQPEYDEARVASPDNIDRVHAADFGLVQSKSQAERLANQRLQRQQIGGEFRAVFLATGWKVQKNSVVRLTFKREGFVQKLFRVVETAVQQDGRVPMLLKEESALLYAWDRQEGAPVQIAPPVDYAPGDTPIMRFIETIDEGATNTRNPETPIGEDGDTVADVLEKLDAALPADDEPPAIPAGLTLTSALSLDTDGSQIVTLRAQWLASTAPDLNGYVLSLAKGAEPAKEILLGPTVTSFDQAVAGNTLFGARISAFDKQGNHSGFSPLVGHTTVKDTTPPAAPTGVTVERGLTSVFLRWTNGSEPDLAKVEIYQGPGPTGGAMVGEVVARPGTIGSFNRGGLVTGQTSYFFLRAVDTSGNPSAYAGPYEAASTAIVVGDFTPGLSPTPHGASLPNPVGYTGPSLFFNDTDGKLYRYVNGAWVTGVPATDIAGTIAANQLNVALGGGNLVRNSSFENGTWSFAAGIIGNGFGPYDNSATVGGAPDNATWSLSAGRRGGNSQRIAYQADSSTKGIYFNNSSTGVSNGGIFKAGVTYMVSIYHRGGGSAIGRRPEFTWNSPPAVQINVQAPVVSGEWQRSVWKVRWDANPDVNGFFYLFGAAATPGWWETDDVQVEEGDVATAYAPALLPGEITGDLIAPGSVGAAAIADGAITDTKVAGITAQKITTQLTSDQIVSLAGAKVSGALDAATLATSKLTGLIAPRQLAISSRGIQSSIEFTPRKDLGLIEWTAGTIRYIDAAGVARTANVTAAAAAYGGPPVTVYYVPGLTTLYASDSGGVFGADDVVILGTYYGGALWVPEYGATVIDGSKIYANTITAAQIAANAITTTHLAAFTITADKLAVGSRGPNLAPAMTEAGSGWRRDSFYGGGPVTFNLNASPTGGPVAIVGTTGGSAFGLQSTAIQVFPGRTYIWRYRAVVDAGSAYHYGQLWYAVTPPADGYVDYAVDTTTYGAPIAGTIDTGWRLFESVWTCPTGVNYVSLNFYFPAGSVRGYTADVEFYEQQTSAMIADGAITTPKIIAGAVNADKIAAGAVTTAKLTVAARPFRLQGMAFSTNAATNTLSWTSGTATYVLDNGTLETVGISAGSCSFGGTSIKVFYAPGIGRTYLDYGTGQNSPESYILIGTYYGGHEWYADYGATIIDGSRIATGSIDALQIKANAITADKLTIGSRAISTIALDFQYVAADNAIYWTSGYILYPDDTGATAVAAITAGGIAWNGSYRYIYWTKGSTVLGATNSYSEASTGGNVIVGTWTGGSAFLAQYGGTIIHGDRITTGTVNANRIVAGTITSNLIGANQIKATNIDAEAVTTNKIAALAITSGLIAAGAILADKIGAGAVTTAKLLIQQPGSALNADPSFMDMSAWVQTYGWQFYANATGAPAGVRYAQTTTTYAVLEGRTVPLDVNKTYRIRGWVAGTGFTYVGVNLADAAGAPIAGDGSYWLYIYNGTPGGWTEVSFVFGAGSVRPFTGAAAAAKAMAPLVLGAYGSGYSQVQDLRIEEVLPATLIKDGAITTGKIAALAITADKIAVGTITADRLQAGTITAAYLAAGAITAEKLAVGTRGPNLVPPAAANNGWRIDPQYGGSGFYISGPGSSPNGQPLMSVTSNPNQGAIQSIAIPVQPGKTYVLSYQASANGTSAGHYAQIWQMATPPADNYVDYADTGGSYTVAVSSAVLTAGQWTKFVRTYTVPIGTNYVSLDFYWLPAHGAGFVAEVEFYEQQTSAVIADGAITTDKIVAGAVTTDRLYALAVTSDKIATNAITADKINAGAITAIKIAAGAITADKLTLGNRAVSVLGLDFSRDPNTGVISWTSGYVYYFNDAGQEATEAINGGSISPVTSYLFFCWTPGSNAITPTTGQPTTNTTVQLASWWGGNRLNVTYGGTILDGSRIQSATIVGDKIIAGSVNGDRIIANTINADRLQTGTILTQTLYLGGSTFRLDGAYAGAGRGAMVVNNGGVNLLVLGWQDANTIGFKLRNNAGETLLDNTYDPNEIIRDDLRFAMPDISVQANYQGVLIAGQLPYTVGFIRTRGNKDITSLATYSVSATQNCTAYINGTSIVVDTVSATGWAEVSSTYNGVVVKARIYITKVVAPPPSGGASGGGSGGGTGGTTSDIAAVNSSSYPTQSTVPMTVKAGGSGQVVLTTYIEFGFSSSGAGYLYLYGKWQWRAVNGTWADVAAEIQADTPAYKAPGNQGNIGADDTSGYISVNQTKTGLTAGADYEFRLLLRSGNYSAWVAGTATATGS